MSTQRIELAPALVAFLDAQFPELGGVAHVPVFACARFPFERLLRYLQRFSGLMFFDRIYLRRKPAEVAEANPALLELLFHEFVHVRQFHRKIVRSSLRYAWHFLRAGYWNHPMEIEARAEAARLLKQYLNAKRHESAAKLAA